MVCISTVNISRFLSCFLIWSLFLSWKADFEPLINLLCGERFRSLGPGLVQTCCLCMLSVTTITNLRTLTGLCVFWCCIKVEADFRPGWRAGLETVPDYYMSKSYFDTFFLKGVMIYDTTIKLNNIPRLQNNRTPHTPHWTLLCPPAAADTQAASSLLKMLIWQFFSAPLSISFSCDFLTL